jgi:hypothetical protein
MVKEEVGPLPIRGRKQMKFCKWFNNVYFMVGGLEAFL